MSGRLFGPFAELFKGTIFNCLFSFLLKPKAPKFSGPDVHKGKRSRRPPGHLVLGVIKDYQITNFLKCSLLHGPNMIAQYKIVLLILFIQANSTLKINLSI